MESNIQPPQRETANVPGVPSSNITENLSPPNEGMESEESTSLERNKNNHLLHKAIAQEINSEITNIQLPEVVKVDKVLQHDEKQIDISGAADFKDYHIEEQQVGPSAKPQNEKHKKYIETDDDEHRNITKKKNKFSYKSSQETEEDLLQSDHEDDINDTDKERKHPNIELNSITLEQEEELLKSDDEEEPKKEMKELAEVSNKEPDEYQKVYEYKNTERRENTTYNLETVKGDEQHSSPKENYKLKASA
ncbi:hypothetical protein EVAR_70647_1 [Eumeta japonica]|uniref:Uncharacterized protein n=1 Tax=Eumeta variegata TaxID=151549 RepID=A0A4C1SDG0_EUMVA|nr:hypothetical protein EVAR_70647_1 [Eumeta japonica]